MIKGSLFFQPRTLSKLRGPGWGTPHEFEVQDPWYEVDFTDDWTACFRLAIQQGRPVVSELRIFPTEDRRDPGMSYPAGEWRAEEEGPDVEVPRGGLTASLVRKVPFDVLSSVPEILEWIRTNRPTVWAALGASGMTAEVERRRPGPKGPSDEELVTYAGRYLDKIQKRVRNPHTALSKEDGYPNSHRSKHLIDLARDRDLLSGPGSGNNDKHGGRAGGMLTPKGEDVLGRMRNRGDR